jgi:nucleoside-diphosphate-sugar epimerase
LEFLATGKSGTIGKFLPSRVSNLGIDLGKSIKEFELLPFSNTSVVIHAGAIVGNVAVDLNPDLARLINVDGTRKLGLVAEKKAVSKFLYISSSHVYQNSSNPLSETDLVSPSSEYASQKFQAEQILREIFSSTPERLCIVRVFSILDWGMPDFSLGGTLAKLADPKSTFILQNSKDVRDFLTPKQVASNIFKLASSEKAFGTINLCTGIGRTVGHAVSSLLEYNGVRLSKARLDNCNSLSPFIVGNPERLLSIVPTIEIDWNPER